MRRSIDIDREACARVAALIAASWRGMAEPTSRLWAQELLMSHSPDVAARSVRACSREQESPSLARILEHAKRADRETVTPAGLPRRTGMRITSAVREANRAVVAMTKLGERAYRLAKSIGEANPEDLRLSEERADEIWRKALDVGPERARQATDRAWTDAGFALDELDRSVGTLRGFYP